MQDEQTQAQADAEGAATAGLAAALTSLMEQLGLNSGAKASFGEVVERDGRGVIPVAQVIIGSGAGGGTDAADASEGMGAGGGAVTRPLGYIEIDAGGVRFVPLKPAWRDAGLVATYAFFGLLLLRALTRLVRG
jgi:uncharacterized spore protein YtfJ